MRVVDELYVSDKLPFRLKVAEELGADHTLTPAELSNYGNYFDIVFEAVGGFAIKTTLNQAIYVTKIGVIILLGAVEISPKIKLGIFHVKEAHLIGSFTLTYQDYIDAYNMVNSKLLRLSRLITHQFPLSEAPKAIRVALSHPESIKVMLMDK
jgi:threonine dehydrogenase-like Zn-dependent dehydrogenase